MNLFALWERVRPWEEMDTYVTILALVLLFLLVLFTQGRSFLAVGAFIGALLGCFAAWRWGQRYADRMGYIEAAGFLGTLLAGVAKIILSQRKLTQPDNELRVGTISSMTKQAGGPGYWAVLLAITGMSLGLTGAMLFMMTYWEMFFWMLGLALMGTLIGTLIGLARKHTGIQTFFELFLAVSLASGIGAIVGLVFVLPIVLYDIAALREISTKDLFRIVTASCAALGALLGVIASKTGIVRHR